MEIKRDSYFKKIVARKHNKMIKVITGMRRSGKSYLLFTLFYNPPIEICDIFEKRANELSKEAQQYKTQAKIHSLDN